MKAKFSTAINVASNIYQEVALEGDEKTLTYRLSEYGEFPATDVEGKPIIQVIDKQAGEYMAQNFRGLAQKVATFFRGIPIYEGHADDSGWNQKNPGHRAVAVGRIKGFENRADGIYVTSVLNSDGVSLLSGEAPRYSGHSPHWRMVEIPGRPGCFRPVLLWSDALTNQPNMPSSTIALNSLEGMPELSLADDQQVDLDETEKPTNEPNMKLHPDALKALGFADGAEPNPEEISAAILKMTAKETKQEPKAEPKPEETTDVINTGVINRAIDIVLADAVTSGRITAADKPRWATALNTSFDTEYTKLQALMPVLNTSNQLGDQSGRRTPVADVTNAADTFTEGAKRFAVQHNIDISTAEGWTRAYDGYKAANPALFKKA